MEPTDYLEDLLTDLEIDIDALLEAIDLNVEYTTDLEPYVKLQYISEEVDMLKETIKKK